MSQIGEINELKWIKWLVSSAHIWENQEKVRNMDTKYTFFKKGSYKKLVLGQPNGYETFSTRAMEVKKLIIFSLIFLLQQSIL